MTFITNLLNNYGYIVLFILLTLELVAAPLPGETLMAYCGFLIFMGRLDFGLCIIFATAGIIAGITISYLLGRKLGEPFFRRHGSRVHMGPEQLNKISKIFNKYGCLLLLVAYFIPGVRHVTGYFSGITKISYRKFAITSYIGAGIWSTTFISLGKILGDNWKNIDKYIIDFLHGNLTIVICIAILLILSATLITIKLKNNKQKKKIGFFISED